MLKPVGLENAKGIVSTAYFKDPEDPQWADDAAVKEYRDALKKYSPKSNPDDAFNMYGWTVAKTMAKALEQMKEPTRAVADGFGAQPRPRARHDAAGQQDPDDAR